MIIEENLSFKPQSGQGSQPKGLPPISQQKLY